MQLQHLIDLLSELPQNSICRYVRSEKLCTFIKIDTLGKRLYTKTSEGNDFSFAESYLKELADRIVENVPFNTSQLLNNKGSNRAIIDSIVAHTSEMYWFSLDRSTYTVWIPSKPHKVGELVEWKNTNDPLIKFQDMNGSATPSSLKNADVIILNSLDNCNFNTETLGVILKDMYDVGLKSHSQVAGIHMFGLKYGNIIRERNISVREIVNNAGISDNYVTEVSKGMKLCDLISNNSFNTAFWKPSMVIKTGISDKQEYPKAIQQKFQNQDFYYRPYITAIKTKPFLLLAGISGTGKSRIVRELARACWDEDSTEYKAQKPKNFEMIQVKPNWHDSTELMGYVSRVSGEPIFIAGDFLKFIAKAWENLDVPHFLCLDEMNLAPIEQYFAEYLSVVESRKVNEGGSIKTDPILKPDFAEEKDSHTGYCKPSEWYEKLISELLVDCPDNSKYALYSLFVNEGISLPQNLIVVGTVNMDETTFSFSRKVLDRAMTIEMNEVDLYAGLDSKYERIGKLNSDMLIGTAVEGVDVYADNEDVCNKVLTYLQAVNDVLNGTPFKVAYRTRNEFLLYVVNNLPYNMDENGNEFSEDEVIATALDEITSMKILSRIEGDDTKVKHSLLERLITTIEAQLLALTGEDKKIESVSIAKLKEMQERLSSGYTSFWS